MWLDRFSAHPNSSASPPPQSRSYSPAPRRPNHLGPTNLQPRPGLSPRSSSLNVSKFNSSTTSVNDQRLPTGSGLRRQISPPPDFRDPLSVLEEVVGKPRKEQGGRDGEAGDVERDGWERPGKLVEEVEFDGLGLQEFVQDEGDEDERSLGDVQSGSAQPAAEYKKDKDKFEDLHRSILACDDVLKSVELSLTNFQKDLGTVSAEIETLQNRSAALNTKLENRKVVEKILGPAVEDISISPATVRKIAEGPIDQAWVIALEDLEKRSKAIDSKMKGPDRVLAVSDVKPLLVDLTNMAIERIRDFFVSQIKSLRSPNINAQILQQRAFLPYKGLYAFLTKHHAQLAEEIAQAYSNTMRWYYLSHFTRYKQALEKMPVYTVDRSDALGADPSSQKGTLLTTSKSTQPPHDPLSLSRRISLLTKPPLTALSSHLAEESKTPTYLETPFYAFNVALTTNTIIEYTFLVTFFPSPPSPLSQKFTHIFGPTFQLGHALTKFLTENTYDCLGLLLGVRITQHLAFSLQRRKCPVADGYINGTNMLLWPRFQIAMDAHIDGLKRATAALPSGTARATLSLTSSKDEGRKGSTAPHVLTQRFGQFLQAILALSSTTPATSSSNLSSSPNLSNDPAPTASDIEPLTRSLARLRTEMEIFLNKAAKGLAGGRRERFLANNWSLVLTILGDTGAGGGLAGEYRVWAEGLRDAAGV